MQTKTLGEGIIQITGAAKIESIPDSIDLLFAGEGDTCVCERDHLREELYRLTAGIVVDVLQNASTYRKKIGITGVYSIMRSKPLPDFTRESNRTAG